ncbi:hybrid sensor histidine kinase/response regulator transcription factor [Pseudozobellia thermophila]|uniref:histidine kinase n=1 Tax=Pseudozobellia thermophila TaxID=192903 RepID=A0A1M6FZX8_9FLAO|nr:hybrid sensor histidine kinase/response regulator transcription factor [Pseudozobellia thermophila]SHJ03204.1 Signal transduction histidine kinase [Pseudozobellia thermophila]
MRYYCTIFIILFMGGKGFAQDIKFGHYNDGNGLSHNSVRHIVQDKYGFLWFGTFSGLNRFDGYQFKSYLSTSTGLKSILNNDITALAIDEESNHLWIGTRGGLTLLHTDTHSFKTFLPDSNKDDALPEQEIRSVYVDKFKRIWVGTRTKGLTIFHPDEESFKRVEIEGFEYVKQIVEDSKGNIWVGSFGTGGIAKITLDNKGNIDKIATYDLPIPNSSEKNPYLNFIYEDHKEDVFIGTREGLYKLDKEADNFENLYIADNELRNNLGPYFLSVARAPDGKYWVGTLGGLLVCDKLEDIDQGKFTHYHSILSDGNSLVDNLVSALYFDASGVLWIGTEDGLDKYDPFENQFSLNKDISQYIGGKVPRIRGFSKTYDGEVLVATKHHGLFISEGEDFRPLFHDQLEIASVFSNDGKVFYCGLWNGKVLVYDYLKNKGRKIDVGFEGAPVTAFANAATHQLLIGSFGEGAVLFDTRKDLPVSGVSRVLEGYEINAMTSDGKGHIWLATENGVVKFDIESKAHVAYDIRAEHVLNNEDAADISDVAIDGKGRVWASSRFGLGHYDADLNDFVVLTKPTELSGRWVTDILVDKVGDLWLNMNNNSVAKLNAEGEEVNIYHVTSGNRLDIFSSKGFYTADGTHIYLGAKNGIIHFSTETLEQNLITSKPVISEFRIANREVFPGMVVNGQVPLKKDINFSKSAELNYDNRNFSIQFSEPSFANEKLNKFQYMLEGFDKEWITTDGYSRTVQYTNLYPNDYVFKIRSRNGDGQWSDTVAYNIKILRPFWLTPEAFVFALAVLGLVFYLVRKELDKRIKLRRELLTEKVNREHDIKLNNEKLRFFTNISHELRTPLTLILGPVKQLMEEGSEEISDYRKSRYELIYQNANRLFSLVNQVLDFRKAQSGELQLKTTKTDILAYSKNIFDSYKELAHNKNITLEFIAENESIIGWVDNDKYDKILYNLLSNALKFTPDFGHVDLYLRYDEQTGYLTVEVSDDGIGIPIKSQKKIFDRFYQATTSKQNNTGSGIGLSLVRSLVKLHKGSIKVKSAPNKGSAFTLEIPIERHFYTHDEVFEFLLPPSAEEDGTLKGLPKKTIHNTELKQKILVVDDNIELRKYLVDYLSGFYKVYEAENGEVALKMCRKIKPTVCICDIMMPVMSGLEFCERLKNDQFISHIPVVLLTALSDNKDKVKGYGTGADGYLVKPFDPSLLKMMIENIIRSRLDLKAKFSGETESEVGLLTHSPVDRQLMQKVTELIDRNLDKADLSTTFLCQELGMSSSKLYQKIKELTDLAPKEFIRTVRLKKAAGLLKSKKYNVSEVTALTGFNDPLYFSRCFKKQFGYPPSKLIK